MARTAAPRWYPLAVLTAVAWAASCGPVAALTIVREPFGTKPPPEMTTGGGTLEDLFDAAAALWEAAIHDEHVVVVRIGWGPLSPDFGAYQSLQTEEDGRATGGTIVVNNADFTMWYLDPTPFDDAEFGARVETEDDLGSVAGPVSVGRELPALDPAAVGSYDLFSVLLHEIGHCLGLTAQFSGHEAEAAVDRDIDVASPLPFAGAAIPIYRTPGSDDHIDIPTASMNPNFETSERRLLSAADVLAVAQLNGFTEVELDPVRTPEPGASWLGGMGAAATFALALARGSGGAARTGGRRRGLGRRLPHK